MKEQVVWWDVRKDGRKYICTLPSKEVAEVGAHAAYGPFVRYPFVVHGPANEEEIAWAEREMDLTIGMEEGKRERLEALE